MKLVLLSDTHNKHDRIEVPDGDVLIHAGDFTMRGREHEIEAFNDWLGTLPHEHKIVIAGNHDWLFETDPDAARALMTNCTYLEDDAVTIDGIKFYGSPWQPAFGNWAFNLERNGDHIRQKWAAVPEDTDVLITHGPPHGVLDRCPDIYSGCDISVGCEALRRALPRINPRLHVFGHIHEGHGARIIEGASFVNASICTARYAPTNKPIVFDLDA